MQYNREEVEQLLRKQIEHTIKNTTINMDKRNPYFSRKYSTFDDVDNLYVINVDELKSQLIEF